MTDSSFELPAPTAAPVVSPPEPTDAQADAIDFDQRPRPRRGGAGCRDCAGPGDQRGADRRRGQAKLDAMVSGYVSAVSSLDVHSQAFTDKVQDVSKLGDEDIRASASVSNRLLDKPLAAMQNGGLTDTSSVSKSLLSLRRHSRGPRPVQAGRPAQPAQAARPAALRCGNKLERLLPASTAPASTTSTRSSRPSTTARTSSSRTTPSIEQEKVNLWDVMGRLRQYAYLAQRLDAGPHGQDRRRSRRPTRTGPRSSTRTCCSTSARSTRTC